MLETIASFFISLWQLWAGLFSVFPYGNSYVPAVCLAFIIICAGIWLVAIKKRRTLKQELGDQYERVETYKRVCNLH